MTDKPVKASAPAAPPGSRCEHCGTPYAYSPQGEYCPNKQCPPYAKAIAERESQTQAAIEEAVRVELRKARVNNLALDVTARAVVDAILPILRSGK